jgi:hypothetical protein
MPCALMGRRRATSCGVPSTTPACHEGQALVHVLAAQACITTSCADRCAGNEHAFVSAESWLGPRPRTLERDDALALLADR